MKLKIISLLLLLAFISESCDDSFDPYTNFKVKYGLACILRSDTTLQIATIVNNYLDQSNNITFPKLVFAEDADVRLWHGDSVYKLKDTSFITNSFDTIKVYYTDQFKIEDNIPIEIEALLTNGKRLKAVSKTPGEISFKSSSEVIIPPIGKEGILVSWNSLGNKNLYQARLRIKCEIVENGTNKIFYIDLPNSVHQVNGKNKFEFPKPTRYASVVYNLDAINLYFTQLADSIITPSRLSIHQKLILEVVTFDEEVSRYISVSSSTLDNLSIRFDEGEYTNISGGLGIFGSQLSKIYDRLKFTENYVRSFGFNFIYDI